MKLFEFTTDAARIRLVFIDQDDIENVSMSKGRDVGAIKLPMYTVQPGEMSYDILYELRHLPENPDETDGIGEYTPGMEASRKYDEVAEQIYNYVLNKTDYEVKTVVVKIDFELLSGEWANSNYDNVKYIMVPKR